MLRRHHCSPGPSSFIHRKAFELTGMRNPDFRYVADFEYWLRLGLYGKFARIPKTLATFRVHPDSTTVSHRGKAMADEHIRLMSQFYSRTDLPTEVHKVRAEAFSWTHLVAATTCGPERREARKHLIKSIRYDPLSFLVGFYKLQIALVIILPKPLLDLLTKTWHTVRRIWQKEANFLDTDPQKVRG